jgi:hypothetical protein
VKEEIEGKSDVTPVTTTTCGYARCEFYCVAKSPGAVLDQFFVGIELAVLAGVVQRDIRIRTLFALINLTSIEWFGINVDADGALVELR